MCSSGSTSKVRRGALLGLACLIAGAAAIAGGCAAPRTPAPRRGYADLDALVRRHPGWAAVAQYDRTLARLEAVRRALPAAPARAGAPLTLPAMTAAPAGVALTPELGREQERLTRLARVQAARLRERLDRARQEELAQRRRGWQAEADVTYLRAVQAARDRYRTTLAEQFFGDAAQRREKRRRSQALQVEIPALRDRVAHWSPVYQSDAALRALKETLAARQSEMAVLNAERLAVIRQAQAERAAALAQARQTREAFVETQTRRTAAALEAQDREQVAAAERRLAAQIRALVGQERALETRPVAAAGALGAETLPDAPGAVAGLARAGAASARGLTAAEAQVAAQKQRWIAFLTADTRAAARDAAQAHHWTVTFVPPAGASPPPAPDVTGQVAAWLAQGAWRTPA